jgi:23S rRNA pseudoU1915 N3-methylase RlmH
MHNTSIWLVIAGAEGSSLMVNQTTNYPFFVGNPAPTHAHTITSVIVLDQARPG